RRPLSGARPEQRAAGIVQRVTRHPGDQLDELPASHAGAVLQPLELVARHRLPGACPPPGPPGPPADPLPPRGPRGRAPPTPPSGRAGRSPSHARRLPGRTVARRLLVRP